MIAIINYEAGNLRSVERAFHQLNIPCRIMQDQQDISAADRIIFPGVGAAGKAMEDLKRLGLDSVLQQAFQAGKPILGICLGAQIILDRSEENEVECLGLLAGKAVRFPHPLGSPDEKTLKIPHMGWNALTVMRNHPVLEGLTSDDEFYFVHSYFPLPDEPSRVIAETHYGISFPSVIGVRNLIAVQFHPEKSGNAGLRILQNFYRWDGRHVE
jgi:glutamine amidotransferase